MKIKILKKILLIVTIIIIGLNNFCEAQILSFVKNGITTITQTYAAQYYTMAFNNSRHVTIKIKPLDAYIVNQNNTSIKYPITMLYVNSPNTTWKQMAQGIKTIIFREQHNVFATSIPIGFKLDTNGILPAGRYTTNVEFTISEHGEDDTPYFGVVEFLIPKNNL